MKIREINPQQKMSQVIETARNLFVAKGYHKVSIPQIVRESGVSIGAIYHHFGNKEGLARSVHEQTLQHFQERLANRIAGCASTREKLLGFTTLVFEVTEKEPVTMEYMLLMKHGEFLSDVPPICSTEPFQLIQEVIRVGIANNELKNCDSFLAAVSFTGVVTRAVELRLRGVMKSDLRKVSDALFGHAWASISPNFT